MHASKNRMKNQKRHVMVCSERGERGKSRHANVLKRLFALCQPCLPLFLFLPKCPPASKMANKVHPTASCLPVMPVTYKNKHFPSKNLCMGCSRWWYTKAKVFTMNYHAQVITEVGEEKGTNRKGAGKSWVSEQPISSRRRLKSKIKGEIKCNAMKRHEKVFYRQRFRRKAMQCPAWRCCPRPSKHAAAASACWMRGGGNAMPGRQVSQAAG